MATPRLLHFSKHLRHACQFAGTTLHLSSQTRHHHHHFLHPSPPSSRPPPAPFNSSTARLLTPYGIIFPRRRRFSSSGSDLFDDDSALTQTDFISGVADVADIGCTVSYQDSMIPVRTLISLLDGYHDLTGFPWWLVIVSSTLAFRVTLFPFVVLQLRKLKRIGELFPKLPPLLSHPSSGRSFRYQLSLFRKERKAIGCPSLLWMGASFAVQVPLFLLWITTFRRMSLDHHPGFDSGGILWFQNLTAYPNGAFGPVLPLLIVGLHYVNVQVSFHNSSIGKASGIFNTLAMFYFKYLEFLTFPLLLVTLNIPQGSLVYWLTNSSLTLIQQVALKHPGLRKKLELPVKEETVTKVSQDENEKSSVTEKYSSEGRINVHDLSPQELVALSVKLLADGQKDKAAPILRLAIDKDPGNVRALLIQGQTLLQCGHLREAIGFLERAISKLRSSDSPDAEGVDLLILSSTWAGVAYIRQGKNNEGIQHLERIANLKEPVDDKSKAHYYDGLLILSSALFNAGRKAEAVEHLRRAAAYDDRYKEYLEQCENDEDDFVDENISSRRSDI